MPAAGPNRGGPLLQANEAIQQRFEPLQAIPPGDLGDDRAEEQPYAAVVVRRRETAVRRKPRRHLRVAARHHRVLLGDQPRVAEDADQPRDEQVAVLVPQRIDGRPDDPGAPREVVRDVLRRREHGVVVHVGVRLEELPGRLRLAR